MKIVSREQWGARPPRSSSSFVRKGRVKLHWTVTCLSERATANAEIAHMRGIQNHHMDGNGWSDIAYNFVVFPSGRVYEGRGLNVRSAANGGSVTNYNHQATALVAGPTCKATGSQLEATGEIVNAFYKKDVKGHRDGHSTTCPGDQIYAWVQREGWNSALTSMGPSFWTWKAWRCSVGPWDGRGKAEKGARYRPRIPGKLSPRWAVWWSKFAASGGCK